ncbi:MAG: serine/threonine-protein kinase [Acidimicrobiales bacterium]
MARTPEWIGRYQIREVIGAGGFATVYRATDEKLGADVALKVLAENHSLDAGVRERFIEEGRRLRRVRSSHLVTVYDLDETERAQPYLVLEWADRGDLARRVAEARRHGRRPGPEDARTVAHAIAAALRVLHGQQLVHRDLAPKNLLLSSDGSPPEGPTMAVAAPSLRSLDGLNVLAPDDMVLLADLGLSKDLAVTSGLTVAAGTSGFTPPEQRESGGTVDRRADVWAASALIVWLAIDRPPDDAGGWRRELRDAGWPPGVSGVLARGLASRPRDRHPTIDEWLGRLDEALHPPPPSPQAPPAGVAAPRRRFRGRKVMLLVVLGAALLSGVGWAAATWLQDRGPEVRIELLAEGGARTTVEDGDIRIVIEGPTDTDVDVTALLTAEVSGTDTWTWVGPDGVLVPGSASFEVVARSPGRTTVRLLATDQQGRIVEATHQLQAS